MTHGRMLALGAALALALLGQPVLAQTTAASAMEAARAAFEQARKAGAEKQAQDDFASASSWLGQAEKANTAATSLLGRVATPAMRREREDEIVYLASMARLKAQAAEARASRAAVLQQLADAKKSLGDFETALRVAREREAAAIARPSAATDAERKQLADAQKKLAELEAARKAEEAARAEREKAREQEAARAREKLQAEEKERLAQLDAAKARLEAMERERAMVAAADSIPQSTSRLAGERLVISVPVANLFTPSNELTPSGRKLLDGVARFLNTYATNGTQVRGHTDDRGASATNLSLSVKRAEAVRSYLVGAGGVAAERLTAEGVGAAEPVATNANDAGRALNRRVDINVPVKTR